MKRKYTVLKSIALGALVVSTSIFAHAQSPRKVLIEEGTNSYCGPCASQNPSFQEWVIGNMPNVIPVTIHASWPGAADPMYQHNTAMSGTRVQYYGFSGVPTAMINGKIYSASSQSWYDGAPGDLQAMETGYNTEIAKQQGISPITMKVTQKVEDGNLKVDVDVSTIEAVNGAKLRVYVVQENVHDPAAGSNGEIDFPWVARTMLPSAAGTTLDLAAGASKVVPLSVPVSSAWDMSKIYIVAFVQNDATKEVLQAASNYINPTTEISSPKAAAMKAPMESEDFSVAVKNTSENAISYQWTLTKSDRTPSDWNANLVDASGDIEVGAGESVDVTIRLVPGATAGIGDAVFTLSPKDNPDQRIYTHQVTVLSSNVEKLNVMAESAADVGVVSTLLTETGHESYIDVTDRDLENLYKEILIANNIKYVVWNGGKAGGITRTGGIALASMLQSGVGVLITGQVSIPLLTSDPSNVLFSTLGVNWDGNSGNISSTQNGTFKLIGVTDDIITDGMSMTGKRVSYVMQELLINGDNTTPILRLQSPNRDIAAKTQLDKARAVVLAFHPDVIQDAAQRKTLIDRSLDWIEGFTAAPTPKAILNFEPEQPIDFGKVMVGKEKEITLEIRAANSAGLEISEISEFSDGLFDKYGISIVGLPSTFPDEAITLAEGEKFSFKLRFAPTEVGEISTSGEEARLSLWTNAEGGVYTIDITGEATENTTSVGETASRNGEFSVSAGPNPFVGSSVVRYSLNGAAAKNVRIALFNEQGREVAVLVNSVVAPGDHVAAIDGANLSAGMYRVVMTVDGESVSLPVVSVK